MTYVDIEHLEVLQRFYIMKKIMFISDISFHGDLYTEESMLLRTFCM